MVENLSTWQKPLMQSKGKNKKKINLSFPGLKSRGPQRWRQAGTLATASPLLFSNYLLIIIIIIAYSPSHVNGLM